MSYLNYITKFLDKYDTPKTRSSYRRKLMVLHSYLSKKYDLHKDYEFIIEKIEKNEILNSAKYYFDNFHIDFQITAKNYLSILNEYFKYLSSDYHIKNDNFIDVTIYGELLDEFNILTNSMKATDGYSPITLEEFESLKNECNKVIISYDFQKNNNYLKYCSAVILKLVMLLGLKNNELNLIKLGAFNEQSRSLVINDFILHLPDLYAQQLLEYKKLRSTLNKCDNQSPLFVTKSGKDIGDKNSEIGWIMQDIFAHQQVSAVAKRAIVNLLQTNLPVDFISDLTGYSMVICQECLETLREEGDFKGPKEKNRIIDAAIRSMDAFDLIDETSYGV